MAKAQASSGRFDKYKLLALLSPKSFCCSAFWQDNPSWGLVVCVEVNFSNQHTAIRQRRHKWEQRQTKPSQEDLSAEPEVKATCCVGLNYLLTVLVFNLVSFCLCVCLQAVETNLASKDSHWVFVNEVRHETQRRSLHMTLICIKHYFTGRMWLMSQLGSDVIDIIQDDFKMDSTYVWFLIISKGTLKQLGC